MPTLRIDQEYDDEGRVIKQSRYNDAEGADLFATSEYTYDLLNRLTGLVHLDDAEETIAEYIWEFDQVGQLISKTDHGVTTDYDYDEQGQLTSEDDGTSALDYDYDPNGNREYVNEQEYTTGDSNQLLSDGVWDYSYDDEGNMTGKEEVGGGVTWTYQYDHANHLVHAERRTTNAGYIELSVDYRYDVFGNRVEKSIDWDGEGEDDPEIQRFALDGWNPAKPTPLGLENFEVWGDLDGAGSLTTRYIRPDTLDQVFGRIANGDALWDFTDHQGSLRDMVTADGLTHEQVNYDAFGNITLDSDLRGRYGFTGREYDVEIEMQYNRARYYDATTGRWINPDPLGFDAGDSNLYRYLRNDSTQGNDPSGLQVPQQFQIGVRIRFLGRALTPTEKDTIANAANIGTVKLLKAWAALSNPMWPDIYKKNKYYLDEKGRPVRLTNDRPDIGLKAGDLFENPTYRWLAQHRAFYLNQYKTLINEVSGTLDITYIRLQDIPDAKRNVMFTDGGVGTAAFTTNPPDSKIHILPLFFERKDQADVLYHELARTLDYPASGDGKGGLNDVYKFKNLVDSLNQQFDQQTFGAQDLPSLSREARNQRVNTRLLILLLGGS